MSTNPFYYGDVPDEVLGDMEDEINGFGVCDGGDYSGGFTDPDQYVNMRDPSDYADCKINSWDIPTSCVCSYWLYASNPKPKKLTPRTGKWLVFCSPDTIDITWKAISDNTKKGKLGPEAKCSTKMGQKKDGNDYVICVYTRDHEDVKDVMRVREQLRLLGVTKDIPYKTDEMTAAGKYAGSGAKVSKYFE